ncbi:HEAT repeat domain-containing protein [Thalassotalea litorea]|uniref:HEAT repeat domain-containing protein n=1 Tax=Thalassotalea litorea TaxID=2020715 RepID=A0A5R9IGG2_9GAMM|nr:HEAT repeat domain-containing protein [Thalassotalea litorea]TLU64624.1 HEAT repeat domain-containing protein [Thalassotalea litorea]
MQDLLEQLKDKRSPKRRSAAKKLRKLGNVEAGSYLLDALEKEIKDERTWETQYQIIMALGESSYTKALPFLMRLSDKRFEATMIYMALGDAIVRLSKQHENDASPALNLLESGNEMLADGALRAIAMLRMQPNREQTSAIIEFVSSFGLNEGIRFWVIAAAPGWEGDDVKHFLEQCKNSSREEFKDAADLALKKKYRKWQPL